MIKKMKMKKMNNSELIEYAKEHHDLVIGDKCFMVPFDSFIYFGEIEEFVQPDEFESNMVYAKCGVRLASLDSLINKVLVRYWEDGLFNAHPLNDRFMLRSSQFGIDKEQLDKSISIFNEINATKHINTIIARNAEEDAKKNFGLTIGMMVAWNDIWSKIIKFYYPGDGFKLRVITNDFDVLAENVSVPLAEIRTTGTSKIHENINCWIKKNDDSKLTVVNILVKHNYENILYALRYSFGVTNKDDTTFDDKINIMTAKQLIRRYCKYKLGNKHLYKQLKNINKILIK